MKSWKNGAKKLLIIQNWTFFLVLPGCLKGPFLVEIGIWRANRVSALYTPCVCVFFPPKDISFYFMKPCNNSPAPQRTTMAIPNVSGSSGSIRLFSLGTLNCFFWDFLGRLETTSSGRIACQTINQSIYNIFRWVAWMMGQTNCQPSVWCSKYFFFLISCKILCRNSFNLSSYFFYKIKKI